MKYRNHERFQLTMKEGGYKSNLNMKLEIFEIQKAL